MKYLVMEKEMKQRNVINLFMKFNSNYVYDDAAFILS